MTKKTIFFWVSYTLLYISLFFGDVKIPEQISVISDSIRMFSYLFSLLGLFLISLNYRSIIIISIWGALTLSYGLYTKDFYWSVLILLILLSKNIEPELFFKKSSKLLLMLTLLIIALFLIGILPDVLTYRYSVNILQKARHSFGFYHSNVLPLITFYLEAYYIVIYKEKIKTLNILAFFAISLLLFYFCDSRNAFYLVTLLSVLAIIIKHIRTKNFDRYLYYLVKYSTVIMSIFSVAMLFLLLLGGIWDKIDTLFSGRFRLAVFKMRRVGIHLINFKSNSDFFSDSINYITGDKLETIAIDNGYLYIILRYGILTIIFYWFISFALAKKQHRNSFCLIAFLAIFIANFIDNDLTDYLFLPMILYAFSDNKNMRYEKHKQPLHIL